MDVSMSSRDKGAKYTFSILVEEHAKNVANLDSLFRAMGFLNPCTCQCIAWTKGIRKTLAILVEGHEEAVVNLESMFQAMG